MSKDFWLTCEHCQHEWVGQPYDEQYPEHCPECESEDFEIGGNYRPMSWPSPFYILLLIPNLVLFS